MSLWSPQHGTSTSQMQVWDSAQVSKMTSLYSFPPVFLSLKAKHEARGVLILTVSIGTCFYGCRNRRCQWLSLCVIMVFWFGKFGMNLLIFTLWACMHIYPPNTPAPTHLPSKERLHPMACRFLAASAI